jgi:predicted nucleotidyltransferase
MPGLMTEPTAAVIVALDEVGEATLAQLARATGRPISSTQRALGGLARSHAVVQVAPRGPWRFARSAPRRPLREVARWTLGETIEAQIRVRSHETHHSRSSVRIPATVRDARRRVLLRTAIERIVAVSEPRTVILFGSQASGKAGPDSDVDLLVVMDGPVDLRKERIALTRSLADVPIAKDILVARPEDLDHPLPGSALADAVREGIVLYGR